VTDTIYSNVPVQMRVKKKEVSIDDEGDLIEHDLLDLVEQEQQKEELRNTPPALPVKQRTAVPTASDHSLDLSIESTSKLVHSGQCWSGTFVSFTNDAFDI
jgi:hypothetical protein